MEDWKFKGLKNKVACLGSKPDFSLETTAEHRNKQGQDQMACIFPFQSSDSMILTLVLFSVSSTELEPLGGSFQAYNKQISRTEIYRPHQELQQDSANKEQLQPELEQHCGFQICIQAYELPNKSQQWHYTVKRGAQYESPAQAWLGRIGSDFKCTSHQIARQMGGVLGSRGQCIVRENYILNNHISQHAKCEHKPLMRRLFKIKSQGWGWKREQHNCDSANLICLLGLHTIPVTNINICNLISIQAC